MTRTLALALALALGTQANAAPRNPECSALTKVFKAAVQARQKGAQKADVDKLADLIDDQVLRQKAIKLIDTAYGDHVYTVVQPAAAGAFFSAACQ